MNPKFYGRIHMYFLLAVAILLAGVNNVLLHVLSDKKIKYNPFLFNALITLVWVFALLAYNGIFSGGLQSVSSKTWIYALVYSLTLSGFIFFKTMAMATGPISLTSLVGCASFILTAIFNATYWKETLGLFDLLGIALMFVCVLMITYTGGGNSEKNLKSKLSLPWKIYSVFYFLFSGAVGIIFRLHQYVAAAHTNEMMIFAAVLASILLLLLFLITKKKHKEKAQKGTPMSAWKPILWTALGCGLVSCIYNRMNIYLSGVLPAALFAPIYNGGMVILSFFAGWWLFKEKPRKIQLFGVIVGLLSIISFSKVFGLF
ncbi:MAG: hypothetical protein E7366_01570 [Clostridiales bacterium]|nr:hypothetical protein [Clostridiales bacterium]